jgi:hypothetical protein
VKKHNLFIITLTVVTLLSGCKKYRSRGSVLSGELLRNNITKVLKEEEPLNVKKIYEQLYLIMMKFITIMILH